MARTTPISIRLDAETQKELEHLSKETSVPVSAIVRMAIEAAVRSYVDNGRRLVLPLKFEATNTIPYQQPEEKAPKVAETRPRKRAKKKKAR